MSSHISRGGGGGIPEQEAGLTVGAKLIVGLGTYLDRVLHPTTTIDMTHTIDNALTTAEENAMLSTVSFPVIVWQLDSALIGSGGVSKCKTKVSV